MIDFLFYFLFVVFCIFSFVSIKQDLRDRKVSNFITFSLFIFAFVLFIFKSVELVWIDFMILFSSFFLSYLLYKKNVWGAADGKIFLGIMLILISFAHSEMFLRWIINLFFFYSITILVLSFIKTSKKVKINTLKKLDYMDSSLVIMSIFVLVDILFTVYVVPESDWSIFVLFFAVFFAFIYKIKKYLLKYFKNLFVDVKYMVFALLFMWNFLYSGMHMFIVHFIFVLFLKTLISFVSNLSDKIHNSDGSHYDSPFSLYLFLTAIFTLITNKSFIEILVLFFY